MRPTGDRGWSRVPGPDRDEPDRRSTSRAVPARELFQQAIALDPAFPRAHAYLALIWAVLPDYDDHPLSESRRETVRAAEAALALDPSSV